MPLKFPNSGRNEMKVDRTLVIAGAAAAALFLRLLLLLLLPNKHPNNIKYR